MRAAAAQSMSTPIDDFDVIQSCSSWYIDELDGDSHNESTCMENESSGQIVEQTSSTDDHMDESNSVHIPIITCLDTSVVLVSMNFDSKCIKLVRLKHHLYNVILIFDLETTVLNNSKIGIIFMQWQN